MKHILFDNGDGFKNITIYVDDKMYGTTNEDPSWNKIIAGVEANDPQVVRFFNLADTAAEHFEYLSDRVSIAHGKVYFDHELVGGELTEQIARFASAGVEDWQPLVNFYEKVMTNLQEHTREQLYRWLAQQNIAITSSGNFVAYKGVSIGEDGSYLSINQGKAIVDGTVHSGYIPNNLGSVVSMPPNEVTHDPSQGCGPGLHAGTWQYASDWARGAVLEVEINPADVVSVPTDCNSAKLRVSRYRVVNATEQEQTTPTYDSWGEGVYDDWDEEEEWSDGD